MDLDLSVQTKGRPLRPVEGEVVRQLTGADLALLNLDRGVKPSPIKKLRDSHHSLARLLAQGLPQREIAVITGYSESRISILKADPSFQELITFYKGRKDEIEDEALADAASKIAVVRNDVLDELHDRLQDEPEAIPTEVLLDALKVTADRSGHGAQSKSMNVNVNVDLAERIAAGRRRVAQLGAPAPAEASSLVADGAPLPRDLKVVNER